MYNDYGLPYNDSFDVYWMFSIIFTLVYIVTVLFDVIVIINPYCLCRRYLFVSLSICFVTCVWFYSFLSTFMVNKCTY